MVRATRFAAFIAVWSACATAALNAQVSETRTQQTDTIFTEEALAERWQLSPEEWAEYRTLMEGPRGVWSPNLDPLTALGIHATTDAERRRYAERLVMLEFERVEQELLFQRAYDEAARRLFPDLKPVTALASDALSSLPGIERIAFVGSVDARRCAGCSRALKRLLRSERSRGTPVDLFLADADDDDALRAWARAEGVSPEDVRAGRVTLNHAQGALAPSVSADPITPRLLQRLAGRWLPLDVER
jgi:integrating conjugative element protein (TIGR03759 family)